MNMHPPHTTASPSPARPPEMKEVHALEVACDGGGGPLGHPRVFLHIDQEQGRVTCPYCSCAFVLKLLKKK